MTSDVKLIVSSYKSSKQRRVLNTQIIQETISNHQPFCKCWSTSLVEYISLKDMNEYEWTLLQVIV